MSHTEKTGTGWSFTSVGWRVETRWVCGWKIEVFKHVWADTLSSPVDQVASTLHWFVSVRCRHQLLVRGQPPSGTEHTTTCWADVKNPPVALSLSLSLSLSLCAAGITVCTSTHGHVKRRKTLADHVLRSMPSSCPTGWKGQLRERQAEVVKAPGWSFTSRMQSPCWVVFLVRWPDEETDTTITWSWYH